MIATVSVTLGFLGDVWIVMSETSNVSIVTEILINLDPLITNSPTYPTRCELSSE